MSEKETPPQLTEEEKQALADAYGFGAPTPKEQHNAHSFLNKVATEEDTTKVGNLTSDELGLPRTNIRTIKEMALIAEKIMGNNFLKDYYNAKAEILTSTSLSKEAKLINLAVIQRRQIEDLTKPERKENKGWFKSKQPQPQPYQSPTYA